MRVASLRMGDRRDQLEEDDDIESTAASAALSSSDHHFYKTDELTLKTTNSHLLWSNIFCLLASVALLATSILFLSNKSLDEVLDVAGLTPIFITILAAFLVLSAILGLVLWHQSTQVAPLAAGTARPAGNSSSDGDDATERASLCAFPITVHYLLNVVGIVLCLGFTIATVSSFGSINNAEGRSISTKADIFRWAFVIVLITNVVALCFAVYGDLTVQWGHRRSAAWGFMLTICVFLLVSGSTLIVLNQVHVARQYRWVFIGFQCVGGLLVTCFLLGICTVALGPGMALDLSVVFYDIGMFVAFLCTVVFVIAGCVTHSHMQSRHKILIEANLILGVIVSILYFTSRQVSRVFGARSLPSGLSIEVLDVLSLSPDQKAQWAAAIDRGNGLRHCGAWDGAGALEMMKAYSRRGVPDIGGLALHVYRPVDGRAPKISSGPTAHAPRDESVALVFVTVVEIIDLTRFVRPLAFCCGRNSLFKSLVVRFMLVGFHWPFTSGVFLVNRNPRGPRRADNVTQIAHALRATVEYNNHLPNAQRAALLLLPAMDTEPVSRALDPLKSGFTSAVLPHTAIVDLRPHKGKTWHEYLHSLKKGNRREFDRQLYAMGGSVHYIQDTARDLDDDDNGDLEIVEFPDLFYGGKNPYLSNDHAYPAPRGQAFKSRSLPGAATASSSTAAAAAGMGSPAAWESAVSALETPAGAASPGSTAAAAAAAAAAAGSAGGPASAAVQAALDLTSGVEAEAGGDIGSVSERYEASYPGWNNDFYELWQRIVNHRVAQGDFPTFYDLTPRMFLDVAKMDPANRLMMLLRLDGRPVGSSVVFKFPRSRMMTCDMQGLDHILGRKAKAYFIMLMRSVRMALEQGYDFVDFGPTTLGPKTDAGATLFPCRLGLYASEPLLRVVTRLCVSAFASYQADVADPNASTASVAKIVTVSKDRAGGALLSGDRSDDDDGGDGGDDHHGGGGGDDVVVVQIIDNKPVVEQALQSEEDIEIIMAMDPAQMTGSQRKRYNKEKKKRAAKANKGPDPAAAAAARAAGTGVPPPNNPPKAKSGGPPPNNPPKTKGGPPPNNPPKAKTKGGGPKPAAAGGASPAAAGAGASASASAGAGAGAGAASAEADAGLTAGLSASLLSAEVPAAATVGSPLAPSGASSAYDDLFDLDIHAAPPA